MNQFLSIFTLFLLLLTRCASDPAPDTYGGEIAVGIPADSTTDAMVYPWVDQLSLRRTPDLAGELVVRVDGGVPLRVTGPRSEESATVTLRGQSVTDRWWPVETEDGQMGWVFAGAVDADPDRARMRDAESAPFWESDPSTWTKRFERSGEGGDATITETVYEKSGNVLQVVMTDVGEYGSDQLYRLYGRDYRLLQERRLVTESGMTSDAPERKESWYDLRGDSPRVGRRSALVSENGGGRISAPFEWSALSDVEVGELRSTALIIEPFADRDLPSVLAGDDSGCECRLTGKGSERAGALFVSDRGDHAAIRLNGRMIPLNDKTPVLRENAKSKHWIILSEKEAPTLFGAPIDQSEEGWEYDLQSKLVEVLLVMNKLPDEIPTTTEGTVGMGTRSAFRDITADALAKARREKDGDGYRRRLAFWNEGYEVAFNGEVTGRGDGGGPRYEGTLDVYSPTGTWLAGTYVVGYCAC